MLTYIDRPRMLVCVVLLSACVACSRTVEMGPVGIARPAAPTSPPSEEQIETEANRADMYLSGKVQEGIERRNRLQSSANVGRWLARLGQLAGGGGAFAFGLDDKGRNAAWSAAIGAGFSFLDDVLKASAKEQAASRCDVLATMEPQVKKHTAVWRLSKGNVEFRRTFGAPNGPFVAFYDLVDASYQQCFR